MTTRRLYIAFVWAAAAWAALIVLAPFLASRAHASSFGAAVTLAVYAIGSAVCHQLPARSFQLWTAQMPVCARCTGIYFGAAVMALVTFRSPAHLRAVGATAGPPKFARVSRERGWKSLALQQTAFVVALAVLPSAATLVFEWTSGQTPANWIRLAAGLPIGVAVAWLVRAAAENQVN